MTAYKVWRALNGKTVRDATLELLKERAAQVSGISKRKDAA